MDVNIALGKSERVVVYEGDTAEELASEFCIEHRLNGFMQEMLTQLLRSEIEGLLDKIVEEDSESGESPFSGMKRNNDTFENSEILEF